MAQFDSPPGPDFRAEPAEEGFALEVAWDGTCRRYRVPTATQQDFSRFYRDLAQDFGTRAPHVFTPAAEHSAASFPWRPLLTENVHPQILVGYGDPAVIRTADGWWL